MGLRGVVVSIAMEQVLTVTLDMNVNSKVRLCSKIHHLYPIGYIVTHCSCLLAHSGDLSYATGYETEWDRFMVQIEPIASQVPYMTMQGNHERDYPGTGSAFPGVFNIGCSMCVLMVHHCFFWKERLSANLTCF